MADALARPIAPPNSNSLPMPPPTTAPAPAPAPSAAPTEPQSTPAAEPASASAPAPLAPEPTSAPASTSALVPVTAPVTAPAPAPTPTPTPAPTLLTTLQSQIDTLTDFSSRLQTLRGLPPLILRSSGLSSRPLNAPSLSNLSNVNNVNSVNISVNVGGPASEQVPLAQTVKRVLEEMKNVKGSLVGGNVQAALKAAEESEKREGLEGIGAGVRGRGRREVRKRRRSPTPESPRPYPAFHPKPTSVFPDLPPHSKPLSLSALPSYIREFNSSAASGTARLHVWYSSDRLRPANGELKTPLVLRFLIPDVMKAYLTVGIASEIDEADESGKDGKRMRMAVNGRTKAIGEGRAEEGMIVVENITTFGSREQKPPHSQSEYLVFQRLSQHLLRMVQSTPRVPFQTLATMMVSYQTLFSTHCTACQRVLSGDGYIPPVARIWRHEQEDSEEGQMQVVVQAQGQGQGQGKEPQPLAIETNEGGSGGEGGGGGVVAVVGAGAAGQGTVAVPGGEQGAGSLSIASGEGERALKGGWEARHVTCSK